MASLQLTRLPLFPSIQVLSKTRAWWTLTGICAIPLWALWPLFATASSGEMPLFQFLAIMHGAAGLTLYGLRLPARPAPDADLSPPTLLARLSAPVMVTLGILMSNVLFVLAIRHLPAAQASLIVYLWPLEIALLAAAFGLVRLRLNHLVAIALGFCGAGVIVGPTNIGGSLTGILLALGSGLVWAVYCVYRLRQGPGACDALTSGLILSGLVALLVHLVTETTAMPSGSALLGAVLAGSAATALPNLAWDVGIRRGNRLLLTVFAYATPLVSACFLIQFGYAETTPALLIGGLLIVAASIVSARKGRDPAEPRG